MICRTTLRNCGIAVIRWLTVLCLVSGNSELAWGQSVTQLLENPSFNGMVNATDPSGWISSQGFVPFVGCCQGDDYRPSVTGGNLYFGHFDSVTVSQEVSVSQLVSQITDFTLSFEVQKNQMNGEYWVLAEFLDIEGVVLTALRYPDQGADVAPVSWTPRTLRLARTIFSDFASIQKVRISVFGRQEPYYWYGHYGPMFSYVSLYDGLKSTLSDIDVFGLEDTPLTFSSANFSSRFTDPVDPALSSIQIVTLPTSGVLSLNGEPVIEGLVIPTTDLGSLTYTPVANENGPKTFTVIGSNGIRSSVAATVTINLAPVNDAPLLSASQGPTEAVEQLAVVVDGEITVSDADNSALSSATVAVNGGYQLGEDVLGYVEDPNTRGNISGVFNVSTGVLTLTSDGASATLAQWQEALRSVTYRNTSDTPNTSDRTVTWMVNDGLLNSAAVTKALSVIAVNDAPTITLGFSAAGGTKTTAGGFTVHTFTGPFDTFTPAGSGVVEVLVVGGGGGGSGSYAGGGGGGGGVLSSTTYAVNAGEAISVLVGGGGAGGTFGVRGQNGGDSQFGSLTALGGGGGGNFPNDRSGRNGGSGGGAGFEGVPGAGEFGQGSAGGAFGTSPSHHGGGGGGAGGTPDSSGVGGVGVVSSISGSASYYAGGGAAGTDHFLRLVGGLGGGGDGGQAYGNGLGGGANTGGGGGGGGGLSSIPEGGNGGAGVVIVRYSSNSSDQTTAEDMATSAIAFTVGDVETAAESLTVTATSSNLGVVAVDGIALGGSGANRTLTLNPVANASGTSTITVTVTDAGGASTTGSVTLTVTAVNDAPTITAISDQTTVENTATGAIAFTVGDVETAAESLTVTATSSNVGVVAADGIALGGSGANRTLTLSPVANASGTSTITVTVTDAGGASATRSCVLTVTAVNDAPTISAISDQTTVEDTATGAIAFTVGDVETAAESLTVTATSSNLGVVAAGGIALGGSGADRTLTLSPVANASGTSTITVTVTDAGGASATRSFVLTVTAVNDAPTISAISDQTTVEDTATGAIAFTVGDVETAVGSLTVTATSSNLGVVAVDGISLGGSGANRTLTLSPVANASGTSTITVTVTDGTGGTATRSFSLVVNAVLELLVNPHFALLDPVDSLKPLGWNSTEGWVTFTGSGGNDVPPAVHPAGLLAFGRSSTVVVSQTAPVFPVSSSAVASYTLGYEVAQNQQAGIYWVQAEFLSASGTVLATLRRPSSGTEAAPSDWTTNQLVLNRDSLANFDEITQVRVSVFGQQSPYVWSGHYGPLFNDVSLNAVLLPNTAPTITAISDQTTVEDTATGAIAFTV
ncbi:MAG: hypothetical protein RIT19_2852, partial [Verrucomicrobiota bacterium]